MGTSESNVDVEDLARQACEIAEKERLDKFLAFTALIAMEDGEILRAGLGGGGQNVAMMAGLFGDQQADFIKAMGNGQGRAAAFINMMDIKIDGQDTALLSVWNGGELVLARKAPIGDQPLIEDSPAWQDVSPDDLMKIGLQQVEAASAQSAEDGDEGSVTIGRMVGSDTEEQVSEGQLTEDQRDKIFRNTIRQFRDGLSELADDESTLMLVMNDPKDGPTIPLHVNGTQGLDIGTILRSRALSSVYMASGANYGVAAWAEKFDEEGERMVVMAGAALSGPDQDPSTIRPEVYTYFIDREGNVRDEQLMLVQSFVIEMLQGWSLANGGELELPIPEVESEREFLTSIATRVMEAEGNSGPPPEDVERFHVMDWDGGTHLVEISDDEASSLYEFFFWRIPQRMIELNAAVVSWAVVLDDDGDMEVTVVGPPGAMNLLASDEAGEARTADLPLAKSVSMVIESIRDWNAAMKKAEQEHSNEEAS